MRRGQRTYANDVDRRLWDMCHGAQVGMVELDIRRLSRSEVPHWIAALRDGETKVRALRERLETLQAGDKRVCASPTCTRAVAGRADARFCSSACRVNKHRRARTKARKQAAGELEQ